ncbi:CD48 antigen-like [Acipenser ruthenus]|uniref:CD48 antigen-like n=1 Tax=Acipenser ruthenus TaxID=7906 RepID=UPI0027424305|nr:CD48 antigen-like [Acipenser ruthenus]
MAHSCRGIRFFISVHVLGSCLSAAQLGVQQVKGIVGESLTFPVEVPNLPLNTEVNWRYGPVGPDWPIARIQNGEIKAGFDKRFTGRLQRDNVTNGLKITNLQRRDSGFYQMETYKQYKGKSRFKLSVYDPVPEPEVNGSVVLANRSCTLLCFVGNASEVNVSWMRDGKPLHTTELEISKEMQGGNVTYTCVASNPASNKTTTVTPSHYCDEKGGAEPQMSPAVIAGIVIAVILAVLSITLYLRRKKSSSREAVI